MQSRIYTTILQLLSQNIFTGTIYDTVITSHNPYISISFPDCDKLMSHPDRYIFFLTTSDLIGRTSSPAVKFTFSRFMEICEYYEELYHNAGASGHEYALLLKYSVNTPISKYADYFTTLFTTYDFSKYITLYRRTEQYEQLSKDELDMCAFIAQAIIASVLIKVYRNLSDFLYSDDPNNFSLDPRYCVTVEDYGYDYSSDRDLTNLLQIPDIDSDPMSYILAIGKAYPIKHAPNKIKNKSARYIAVYNPDLNLYYTIKYSAFYNLECLQSITLKFVRLYDRFDLGSIASVVHETTCNDANSVIREILLVAMYMIPFQEYQNFARGIFDVLCENVEPITNRPLYDAILIEVEVSGRMSRFGITVNEFTDFTNQNIISMPNRAYEGYDSLKTTQYPNHMAYLYPLSTLINRLIKLTRPV